MRFRRHQEAAHAATRRLSVLFVAVVVLLVVAVNLLLALAYRFTFPIAHGYPSLFFETNTAIVLLFVLGGSWVETQRLRGDPTHIARMAGGRPAQLSGSAGADRLERRFANIVQEMALASRWPAPAAWVLPRDEAINAFAVGWRPEDGVVAVTRGALERLSREELQGVVAHEFSHLVHGDTRLNMRLVGFVWGLQMVFMFGRQLSTPDERGRRPAGTLFGWALVAVGSLGWLAGRLLQAAMSRQREYLADASAVQFTRQVDGLGGALRKIAHQAAERRDRLLASQASSMVHLCLHAPGQAWWSGHPPIAERLRRLYGRSVEALVDEPLPLPADEPVVAFAPPSGAARPAGAVGTVGVVDGSAALADGTSPAAWRDDPLQRAALSEAADRERDALQRIERWHGVRQQRIALLALVDGRFDEAARHAWLQQHRELSFAPDTWRELAVLSPSGRLAALTLLSQRFASAPVGDQRLLHDGLCAQGTEGLAVLRRLMLRQARRRQRALASRVSLQSLAGDAVRATAMLATALPTEGHTWADAVAHRLGASQSPTDAPRLRQALRLRHLAPMERPQLVRPWLECAPAALLVDEAFQEAMHIACALLDTPVPPALQAAQPAQARSL